MPTTKKQKRKGRRGRRKPKYTAATADRHVLYQLAVQDVESEIDFVDETFKELRGEHGSRLREDFCGTANTSCEWVRRRKTNEAVGIDIDQETLDWGVEHNVGGLAPEARGRVRLLNRNVLEPGGEGENMDIVIAMNFSYFTFPTRHLMRQYFEGVRGSLATGGLFMLDFYGGYESMRELEEERDVEGEFTYVWDQARYNPISGAIRTYIHFKFKDGSKMRRAFSYDWRLWTLPELRELLEEAGFARSTVYCEGTDEEGEGDGDFQATEECDADASFIAYIVAEP